MKKWIALGGGLLALWVAYFAYGAPSVPNRTTEEVERPPAAEALPAEEPASAAQAPLEPDPKPAQANAERPSAPKANAAPLPMPPSGHFDAMQRAYDAESRDAAWAREQEARIPQLLAEVGFPSAAFGRDATCRRTLCRFQLVIGDDDLFALMKLGAKVQTSQGLGLAYGAAELVDGKSRVVVYTPREGSSRESLGNRAELRGGR